MHRQWPQALSTATRSPRAGETCAAAAAPQEPVTAAAVITAVTATARAATAGADTSGAARAARAAKNKRKRRSCAVCGHEYVCRTWSESGHGFCMNPHCVRSKARKETRHTEEQPDIPQGAALSATLHTTVEVIEDDGTLPGPCPPPWWAPQQQQQQQQQQASMAGLAGDAQGVSSFVGAQAPLVASAAATQSAEGTDVPTNGAAARGSAGQRRRLGSCRGRRRRR